MADTEPGADGAPKPDADSAAEPALSYETARDELIDVVRRLEAGGLPLEDSLALWERGEELAVTCQSWLDGAKRRLAAAQRPVTGEASEVSQ